MAECHPQLSATQEACQAELQEIESMCGMSCEAEEASLVQQVGRRLQEEDWREVVYKVSMPHADFFMFVGKSSLELFMPGL